MDYQMNHLSTEKGQFVLAQENLPELEEPVREWPHSITCIYITKVPEILKTLNIPYPPLSAMATGEGGFSLIGSINLLIITRKLISSEMITKQLTNVLVGNKVQIVLKRQKSTNIIFW